MKIHQLLSSPPKWTQGVCARDYRGYGVEPRSTDATCWCLVGAIEKCYPDAKQNEISAKVHMVLNRPSVSSWNDAKARTFEQVKLLVTELDI